MSVFTVVPDDELNIDALDGFVKAMRGLHLKPEGEDPECFCGDVCKMEVSGDYETLWHRYCNVIIIGLQCAKSATHCRKRQNTRFNTGQYRPLSLGNHLPPVLMTHLVHELKCDMTFNILGTFV
jgi:hypothetical protein